MLKGGGFFALPVLIRREFQNITDLILEICSPVVFLSVSTLFNSTSSSLSQAFIPCCV